MQSRMRHGCDTGATAQKARDGLQYSDVRFLSTVAFYGSCRSLAHRLGDQVLPVIVSNWPFDTARRSGR